MIVHIEEDGFTKQLRKLPPQVVKSLRRKQECMTKDPNGPWVGVSDKHDSRKGRHRDGSWAARLASEYRALFVRDGESIIWYWIGSHAAYDNFLR